MADLRQYGFQELWASFRSAQFIIDSFDRNGEMEAADSSEVCSRRNAPVTATGPGFTERLLLRRWRLADREPFAELNKDPKVMEFFPRTLSVAESNALVDRIEAHFEKRGFGLFAAELRDSSEFIGYIGLAVPSFDAHFMHERSGCYSNGRCAQRECVEIGWRLAAAHWGRGLATEGARALLRYGFETLQLREIVSFTVPANLRSIRVMEKIGMVRDPRDDFDHPDLPEGHSLRRHVLYRAQAR